MKPLKPDAILPAEPEPAPDPAPRPAALPVPVRNPFLDGNPTPEHVLAVLAKKVRPRELYRALIADARTANTRAAREFDIKDFARWLKADPSAACAALVLTQGGKTARDAGRANALAAAFRKDLLDRSLAPGTVNRRMTTLKRVCTLARRFALISWDLDYESLPAKALRDTRGPSRSDWQKLWAAALALGDRPGAIRDRACLRLCHDLALRRGEVAALDVEHVDLEGGRLAIKGKGRLGQLEWLTLPEPTIAALRAWLAIRGATTGPLFISCRPWPPSVVTRGRRMDAVCISRAAANLSARAGLKRRVKPHGLRHASVTRALDLTNGDVRRVRAFSRHASLNTVCIYDDARRDDAGKIARLVAEDD